MVVHDISTSGVAVLVAEVSESLTIGCELYIDLNLEESVGISVEGTVRHHTNLGELGTIVGIEFLGLSQDDFHLIRDYVAGILSSDL